MRCAICISVASAAALAVGIAAAAAAPARIALPTPEPGALVVPAVSGVTGEHAIKAKPGRKFVKRRIHHGYWQECSYDGYCRYVYNGTGGYLKAR